MFKANELIQVLDEGIWKPAMTTSASKEQFCNIK